MIETVIDREIDRMPAEKRLPFARTLLRAAVLSPGELNVFAVLLATRDRVDVPELMARAEVTSTGALRMAISRIREKLGHEVTITNYGVSYGMVGCDG
jgi:hypothetical protein